MFDPSSWIEPRDQFTGFGVEENEHRKWHSRYHPTPAAQKIKKHLICKQMSAAFVTQVKGEFYLNGRFRFSLKTFCHVLNYFKF